jgi:hypothetical protein
LVQTRSDIGRNYPLGVSSYSTSKELPEEFIAQLPTLEAIKKSFGK